MKSKTAFVYFDLGGVVMLDFSGTDKWPQLKKELGVMPEKDQEFEDFWEKYEAEACVGRDVETLLPLIKAKFGNQLPKDYSLLSDGFVNRFEVNQSIWPVIEEILRHSRVGLLTNMYPGMYRAIAARHLLPNIPWEIIIDSSIEKIQKPNPEIFKLAQQRAGVKGEEILFVENSPLNIRAAQSFGWQTFLYDSAYPEESSRKLSLMIKLKDGTG